MVLTMKEWKNDKELFSLMRDELYAPVIGDILDSLGLYHQTLPQSIQPIRESDVLVGRAMPVLQIDVHGPQKKPFGYLTEALDQLEEDEVYIASGGDMRCAYWGDILTTTSRLRGAAGAVINGYHRDTPQVMKHNWPVFSRGRYSQDSSVRTQVIDFRCPIEIESVWIEPGDLVFADLDGTVIIPKTYEKEVIKKSLEKVSSENIVIREILKGMSATQAFAKYGVL